MTGQMNIFVRDLKLFGYHGVFEEEHRTGGYFMLDITVRLRGLKGAWDLKDSVDYGSVYEIAKTIFAKREALLETVATNIAAQILKEHAVAQQVSISITKLKAPIAGLDGHTGVSLQLER